MHAADLLTSRTRLTPDREALFDLATGRRFTYAQLNARANRLANFMRERLGVQAGDRVSMLAHNSVAYLDMFYGLAKIGAIFTPLNWRLTAAELSLHRQRLHAKGDDRRTGVRRRVGRDANRCSRPARDQPGRR